MVRHGETQLNVECRFLGRLDVPLNETGKKQATFTRAALRNEKIDIAYTSPLKRASETAEIICDGRNIDIIPYYGLREISCGDWEGYNGDEVEERWPGQIALWGNEPDNVRIQNGDTFQEVAERIETAFFEIVEKERGKTVLITSHMICLQLLMLGFIGKKTGDIWKVTPIANAALNVVYVSDDNSVEIEKWSDASFIPKEFIPSDVPIAGKDSETE